MLCGKKIISLVANGDHIKNLIKEILVAHHQEWLHVFKDRFAQMNCGVIKTRHSTFNNQIVRMISTSTDHQDSSMDKFQQTISDNENVLKHLGINESEGLWLFGYGSLLWKADFDFRESKIGTIEGYKRCFWQGSKDHRGTPEKPGRVATLIPTFNKTVVWGRAYYISPDMLKKTMDILNFREKDGYALSKVAFTPRSDPTTAIPTVLYIASEDNYDFLGDECLDKIALQIATTAGPSGPNYEYLIELAKYLEDNDMVSENDQKHTIQLRNKVQLILNNNRHGDN